MKTFKVRSDKRCRLHLLHPGSPTGYRKNKEREDEFTFKCTELGFPRLL